MTDYERMLDVFNKCGIIFEERNGSAHPFSEEYVSAKTLYIKNSNEAWETKFGPFVTFEFDESGKYICVAVWP